MPKNNLKIIAVLAQESLIDFFMRRYKESMEKKREMVLSIPEDEYRDALEQFSPDERATIQQFKDGSYINDERLSQAEEHFLQKELPQALLGCMATYVRLAPKTDGIATVYLTDDQGKLDHLVAMDFGNRLGIFEDDKEFKIFKTEIERLVWRIAVEVIDTGWFDCRIENGRVRVRNTEPILPIETSWRGPGIGVLKPGRVQIIEAR